MKKKHFSNFKHVCRSSSNQDSDTFDVDPFVGQTHRFDRLSRLYFRRLQDHRQLRDGERHQRDDLPVVLRRHLHRQMHFLRLRLQAKVVQPLRG